MADPFDDSFEDIEEQALPNTNPSDSIDHEVDEAAATSSRPKTPSFPAQNFIVGVLCLTTFPLIIIHVILSTFFAGRVIWPDEWLRSKRKSPPNPTADGVYSKMFRFKSGTHKYMRFKLVITVRLGCLFFLWLLLNLCVPSLKSLTLLGSLLWKWSLLAVVVLLGYPTTRIAIRAVFRIGTSMFELDERLGIVYLVLVYGECVTLMLYYSWILVVWFLYFHTGHGLNPSYGGFDMYGTWTFVSLLVSAVLWTLKKVVLVQWRERAIYKRFKPRILMAAFQLFFLFVILHDSTFHCLLPWRYYLRFGFWGPIIEEAENGRRKQSVMNRRGIQNHLSSRQVNLLQLRGIVNDIRGLAEVMLREEDHIAEFVQQCEEKVRSNKESEKYITEKYLVKNFPGLKDDVHFLLEELRSGPSSNSEVTFEAFRNWMVDAHKNCLSLGYTLIDASSVVSVLNGVLTAAIVMVVALFWLLVTGLATTKVLVAVVSPFLALTFMFGDTCKAFFQGVIFSFLSHPFDIGDRCVINGVEVEVKRIGILTTTCMKIETGDKMLYPNSDLAVKLIINLGGKPDPTDVIELILDSSTTKSQIQNLRNRIRVFLDDDAQHSSYETDHRVMVKEMGNNIKLSIKFRHVMSVEDLSHLKCFEKKSIQRSEFLLEIKGNLEDLQMKIGTQ